jgi:hypothetical protein
LKNLIHIFGSEQHALEVIGEQDLDGDHEINFEEFRRMMTEHDPYSKALHHSNRDPSFSDKASTKQKGAAESD